jgi:hypothetical protein
MSVAAVPEINKLGWPELSVGFAFRVFRRAFECPSFVFRCPSYYLAVVP